MCLDNQSMPLKIMLLRLPITAVMLLLGLPNTLAFALRTVRSRRSTISTVRLASTAMPHDDEKMPFYALGTSLGVQLGGEQKLTTLLSKEELQLVIDGFSDHLLGKQMQDPRMILTTYGMALNTMLKERSAGLVDKMKEEGEQFIDSFLDCNEEAVKTKSGLVYCSMVEGSGKKPTTSNTVEVHYHGTLIDGTVFDSSVDRGQTISFPLSGVIKGWQEGLAMMKEGGKATLVIPSDLAYGDTGSGDTISPGATLKFEVELFSVK